MTTEGNKNPELFALDSGGTMTDSFVVDENGEYIVGKAQSTPENESVAVQNALGDALSYWDSTLTESGDTVQATIYSGTAMLNRLLEREGTGENIGIITNKGAEDTLRFGRGIQSWVNLSYSGRLHAREHEHPEPLVPQKNIRGIRSRIHTSGDEIIPLYEEEAYSAIEDLVKKDLDIICVCMLYSYKNNSHETRIKEIGTEIAGKYDKDVSFWLSCEQNPLRGELPRLNTLVLEAYAVEPSRKQLHAVRDSLVEHDVNAPFRVLTSSGETVTPEHDWLVDTVISGPIGGIFGGNYLSEELGISNLVCSDVGGTSFEVGLVTEGHYPTRWDRSIAQFMVNLPAVAMDSIGSGTGSFVRVDETSNRLEVGPDSAGYLVGVSNEDSGLTTPTVTDCTALLGYLNPDFFLGGDIDLNTDRALEFIEEKVATKYGEGPYETARGVLDIVERNMTNELNSMILDLGYSPQNYSLISYGGGGPLHAAGYTRALDFEDILIPEWAAAFSAFGCATADYAYRYDQSLDILIEPDLSNIEEVAAELTTVLQELKQESIQAFERDGVDEKRMSYRPSIRMQYGGLLSDLEITIPQNVWNDGLDKNSMNELIERYQNKFGKIFQRAAHSPEQGYNITMAAGEGVVPSPDPTVPTLPLEGETPPNNAVKSEREIYWDGAWHDATIWDMNRINPGNVIQGPSVAEAPATTMLVPPGFEAELDKHNIYHLTEEE